MLAQPKLINQFLKMNKKIVKLRFAIINQPIYISYV